MQQVKDLRAELKGIEEELVRLQLEKKTITQRMRNKFKEKLYKEQACERALVTVLGEEPKQLIR